MRRRTGILVSPILSLSLLLVISGTSWGEGNDAAQPKLVLQITVDQFRGDLPTSHLDRLGKGGLRYLLEKGVLSQIAFLKVLKGLISIFGIQELLILLGFSNLRRD